MSVAYLVLKAEEQEIITTKLTSKLILLYHIKTSREVTFNVQCYCKFYMFMYVYELKAIHGTISNQA